MIRCIQCAQADLQPKTVQLPGTIRSENYTAEMQGLECPNCGYKTIEGATMPEYGRLLADKYRAAHGLLTSDEIRARRRRLGMSQAKFAQYVGVGLASIKRWEMGRIQDKHHNEIIKEKTDPEPLSTRGILEEPIIASTSSYSWAAVFEHIGPTQTGSVGPDLDLLLLHRTVPAHLAAAFLIRPGE